MLNLMLPSYCDNSLDRMDYLRAVDSVLDDEATLLLSKHILIFKNSIVVRQDSSYYFSHNEVLDLLDKIDHKLFLGGQDGDFYFALQVEALPSEALSLCAIREFTENNIALNDELGILAQALAALNWHRSHQYCSRCGGLTEFAFRGWRRDCPACQAQHFPRVDPVVIMLVTNGGECLLGCGKDFSNNRFSCLAGFVEPGETLEAAAARELFEEAGVVGSGAQYIVSQPWPYPFTMMMGMHIKTDQKELKIDTNELANAMWVSKADVRAVINGDTEKGFSLPGPVAVAHSLLQYWISQP